MMLKTSQKKTRGAKQGRNIKRRKAGVEAEDDKEKDKAAEKEGNGREVKRMRSQTTSLRPLVLPLSGVRPKKKKKKRTRTV